MNPRQSHALVTCFYDLGRDKWQGYSRTVDQYLAYSRNILSLQSPIIIFTEGKFADYFRSIRPDAQIIIREFKDLYTYQYFDKIHKIQKSEEFKVGLQNPGTPEVSNPLYPTLIHMKTEFMTEAAQMGPEYLTWIDIGFYKARFPDRYKNREFPQIDYRDGKIHIGYMNLPNENIFLDLREYYKSHLYPIMAGIWGGHREVVKLFAKLCRTEFELMLGLDRVNTEQMIYTLVAYNNYQMFHLHPMGGDFDAMFPIMMGDKIG